MSPWDDPVEMLNPNKDFLEEVERLWRRNEKVGHYGGVDYERRHGALLDAVPRLLELARACSHTTRYEPKS